MDLLEGVTVFMTVAQRGSFSAAAEVLGCSKSTVSAQVTRLEHRIGAGRAYLAQIGDLLDRVGEAEKAARAEATEPRGVLRLSAPSPFASLHLAPILPEFLARHPEVRIDMHVTSEVVDLVAGGFDLAIRLCPRNDPSMIIRRLGGTRVVAVGAPSLLTGRPAPVEPEDLAGLPALTNASYPDRDTWRLLRGGEERAVPVSPILGTGCPETLLALARAGVGIGQFGEYHVADDLRSGRLLRLTPGWTIAEVPILAVYPDNRQIAVKVRAFVDFLIRHLPDTLRTPAGPSSGDEALCKPLPA